MDFYNVKDIMKITGCSRSYCYEILVKLREEFKNEYPNSITIRGKIPKWYFEKKLKTREENDEK